MDICSRIYERKTRRNGESRFEFANLIASIVCRIAIFLIVLPGICMAEEDSVLSLPALKKTDSSQKQGVRKDSRSLP